jgi:hypothetical protein
VMDGQREHEDGGDGDASQGEEDGFPGSHASTRSYVVVPG